MPSRAEHTLGMTYASAICDADIRDGCIKPYPCVEEVCESEGPIGTIISTDPCCTFDGCVNEVKDFCCANSFWTEEIGDEVMIPQVGDPCGESCDFTAPCPDAPTVMYPDCEDCKSCFSSYRFAYVLEIGGQEYQGEMSPPSQISPHCPCPDVSGWSFPDPCITKVRVYRAESGFKDGSQKTTDNAGWFYVGETSELTFTDCVDTCDLQPADPFIEEFRFPPEDLRCITMTDDGVYAGLSGREIWITLVGQPNTWRPEYTIHKDWGDPVAVCALQEDLVVMTTNRLITYNMGLDTLGPRAQRTVSLGSFPICSKKSIAKGNSGIIFASTAGLVAVQSSGVRGSLQAQVISSPWFSAADWKRMDPESMVSTMYNGSYIMSTSVDSYMFSFGDGAYANAPETALTGLNLPLPGSPKGEEGVAIGATALVADEDKCTIHFGKDNKVYEWRPDDQGEPRSHKDNKECDEYDRCPYFYRSAQQRFPRKITLNSGRADVDSRKGETEMTLYRGLCDGECDIACVKEINCDEFRMGGCGRSNNWFFELCGTADVCDLTLATSCASLGG